jgi:hypothetical protein
MGGLFKTKGTNVQLPMYKAHIVGSKKTPPDQSIP